MAFSSAVLRRTVEGDKRVVYGTYDCNGVTGGDIATALAVVEYCSLQPSGASVEANAPVVNETFPLNGGDVTIVTDSGKTGFYRAVGR